MKEFVVELVSSSGDTFILIIKSNSVEDIEIDIENYRKSIAEKLRSKARAHIIDGNVVSEFGVEMDEDEIYEYLLEEYKDNINNVEIYYYDWEDYNIYTLSEYLNSKRVDIWPLI